MVAFLWILVFLQFVRSSQSQCSLHYMVDYFELATKIWVDNPIQCPMGCAPLLGSPNLHSFFFISEWDMTIYKKMELYEAMKKHKMDWKS